MLFIVTNEWILGSFIVGFILISLMLLSNNKVLKKWSNKIKRHKPIEEDKVSQMIHSEPFALNAYIVLNANSKIIGVNSKAIKMFGWKEDEVKGHGMDKIITSECLAKYEDYKINHLQKEYESIVEVDAKTKSGEVLHIDLLIGKWTDDLDWFYTVIIRDITHRRRNEEALRIAQDHVNYLRELYHEGEKIGNVAFWKMDLHTGKVTPSANFNHLFGVKGVDIPTESLIRRIDVEDKVKVSDSLRMAKEKKMGYDITYKLHGIDGYISTFRSITSVVKKSNGEVRFIIGMTQLIKKEKPSWEN